MILVVVDPVVLVVAAALAAEAEAAEGEGEHEGVEAVEEVRAQPDCAGGQLKEMGGFLQFGGGNGPKLVKWFTYSHFLAGLGKLP